MPNLLLTMWDTPNQKLQYRDISRGRAGDVRHHCGTLTMLSYHYHSGGIKSRTVGDGQHGTARWATDKEIRQTYAHVPFKVKTGARGVSLPTEQGLVLGCKGTEDG